MNKNNFFKLVVIVSTMFTLVACGVKISPTDVVDDFLTEYKAANFEAIRSSLNTVDGKNFDEAFEEIPKTGSKIKELIKKTSYTINSENIDKDNATVNVTVKGIDLNTVLSTYISEAFDSIMKDNLSIKSLNEEKLMKDQDKLLKKILEETEFTERTGDLSLQRIDEEWIITKDDKLIELLFNINENMMESFSGLENYKEKIGK